MPTKLKQTVMLLALGVMTWGLPVHAAVTPPHNFADIVAPLMPAVVNISTTTEVSRERPPMDMPNFPPGSPFEELFRHFFEGNPQLRSRKATSLGSGFIISQNGKEALIVTCNHVIADAEEITVTLQDETELKATVVGRDPRTDLALLKVVTDKKLTTVEWADPKDLRVGDWLIAIGNPFGLGGTVTVGIVSNIARDLSAKAPGLAAADYIDGYIQTDASINMGNSGGPMFNVQGKVIGISTAIFSPNGGNIGIGFGVPVDIGRTVIDQLKNFGRTKRGWLGVELQEVDKSTAEALGLEKPSGALVKQVVITSPAAKAGVKRGDVIVKFNGQAVRDLRALPRLVGESAIGQKATITVWRAGKEVNLEAVVGQFEEAEEAGLIAEEGDERLPSTTKGERVLGLTLQPLRPNYAERYGLPDDTKAVMVVHVDPDSDAAEKGVRPGDLITEIIVGTRTEKITTPAQVAKLVEEARKSGRKQVLLLMNRGGTLRYIPVALQSPQDKSKRDKK
ncbi:MAG: Do family serine endopeptidase [Holosporales bacterium]